MGLLEKDALLCQLVDVWCLRLGMSSKTTNPVVQIVDGDEQHVRSLGRPDGPRENDREEAEDERQSLEHDV